MDGVLVGAVVVSLLMLLLRGPATRLLAAASGAPLLRSLLTAE
jgi:hypothetical protein